MTFKNIKIIFNQPLVKEEAVLSYLTKAFLNTGIDWELLICSGTCEVYNVTKQFVGYTDLIAIYGGDGSVCEAARALYGSSTPLAILPAGTANVMSKELGIPQDIEQAVYLLTGEHAKVVKMDMGLVNQIPFMLRINLGIMADMIMHTDREMKDNFGQVAYGITALRTLAEAQQIEFWMVIDGVQFHDKGVALTITNAGNIGIGDFTFLPGISVTDGFLDVILMNDSDLFSVLKIAGTTLLQTDSGVLKHWRCRHVSIELDGIHQYICDDVEKQAGKIDISISQAALNVLVPGSLHIED